MEVGVNIVRMKSEDLEQVTALAAQRDLVRVAEDWARKQGLTMMRVRSNVVREEAHKFYGKIGYELKKTWCLFVREM